MKKIFIALLATASLLGSCSDDQTTDEVSQDAIEISTTMIPVGAEATTADVKVTSSGDWRIAGSCDWAHPTVESGKNGDTVTFIIDANHTSGDRKATFKFFTGSAVATLEITTTPGYTIELLSESDEVLTKAKNTLRVGLRTNVSELTYSYSDGGEDWIAFVERTDALGNTNLSFSIAENKTYNNRSSIVTISGQGVSVDVKVMQNQVDAIVSDKISYDVEAAGATVVVNFSANVDYIVEIPERYASWIHHATDKSATRGLTSHSESFTIDPAQVVRKGNVIIKKPDGTLSITISIGQAGSEHHYATIPDANFRKWLADNNYVIVVEDARCELTQDGLNATSFSCSNKKIQSLEGIKAFEKLTSLSCGTNPIERIELGDMKVTSVDTNGNTAVNLVVSGDNITSVNARMSYQQLATLDVSGCPLLNTLDISFNYYMTTLYLSKAQEISVFKDSYAGDEIVGGYKKEYK